nr:ATP-binding protein [uncultured Dongia sp.]
MPESSIANRFGTASNTVADASDRPSWHILIDAIEKLSAARNFARVIDIVKQAARQIAGADGATVVLREGEHCYYVDEDAISPLWKGHKFPMNSCISGWAMTNRAVAVIPDIYLDDRIPHDAYRPTFVKSLVMVPVRVDDPLAAIGVYWAKQFTPGPDEIALLESLARATATAIANVNLEISLRETAAKAEAQAEQIRLARETSQTATARQAHIEEQLRQAQKMEAIGQLTGGIAHDFNNLLSIIVGNLDTLTPRLRDPVERDLANEALNGALRGAELTKQLLMFARRQELAPAPTDVGLLMRESATLLGRTLGDSIAVTVSAASDLWLCLADPNQIDMAVLNLAINARDAMPDGGTLTIETSNVHLDASYADSKPEVMAGDYVKIAVSDTGCGMAPDVLQRVFEPFFTTKNAGQGTGLGLSMVYGFAKQSGGHLSIYSEVGFGTTVNLYLPRATQAMQPALRKEDDFPLSRIGHEIILVVDDHDAVRKTSVMALKGLGYHVLEAKDAGEAIDILASRTKVDLVFSDVAMPGGLSGFDLAKHVLFNHPTTKVVLVTGFAEGAARDRGNVPAHVKLLSKPFRRAELAGCIRDTLDGVVK